MKLTLMAKQEQRLRPQLMIIGKGSMHVNNNYDVFKNKATKCKLSLK